MTANNETGVIQPMAEIAAHLPEAWRSFTQRHACSRSENSASSPSGSTRPALARTNFTAPKAPAFSISAPGYRSIESNSAGRTKASAGPGPRTCRPSSGWLRAAEEALRDLPNEQEREQKLRDELWRGSRRVCPAAVTKCRHRSAPRQHAQCQLSRNDLGDSAHGAGSRGRLRLERLGLHGGVGGRVACSARDGIAAARAGSAIRFSLGRGTTATEIEATVPALERIMRGKRHWRPQPRRNMRSFNQLEFILSPPPPVNRPGGMPFWSAGARTPPPTGRSESGRSSRGRMVVPSPHCGRPCRVPDRAHLAQLPAFRPRRGRDRSHLAARTGTSARTIPRWPPAESHLTARNGAAPAPISGSRMRAAATISPSPSDARNVATFTPARIAAAISRAPGGCGALRPVWPVAANSIAALTTAVSSSRWFLVRQTMFVWQKQASDGWLAKNEARLAAIAAENLAIISRPGRARSLVQIFCRRRAPSENLIREFGGSARPLARDWLQHSNRAPIRVGGRLEIVSEGAPSERHLIIPAAGAFGTGEHSTTAMSLRLLEESTRQLPDRLATARCRDWHRHSRAGGAQIRRSDSARTGQRSAGRDARPPECAAQSHLPASRFMIADILPGNRPDSFEIITANLFSELLIASLPSTLSGRALRIAERGRNLIAISGNPARAIRDARLVRCCAKTSRVPRRVEFAALSKNDADDAESETRALPCHPAPPPPGKPS